LTGARAARRFDWNEGGDARAERQCYALLNQPGLRSELRRGQPVELARRSSGAGWPSRSRARAGGPLRFAFRLHPAAWRPAPELFRPPGARSPTPERRGAPDHSRRLCLDHALQRTARPAFRSRGHGSSWVRHAHHRHCRRRSLSSVVDLTNSTDFYRRTEW